VIIYHSFAMPYVYYLGKQLGIPCIPASIDPLTTRAHPALALNIQWDRSKAFNLFTHQLVDHFAWQVFWPVARKAWKGKISISSSNPYKQILMEKQLVLCGYSPSVVPRPADLPEQVVITGYWFLEPEPTWKPDPEIVRFIQSGRPPIYVGFGSMGNPNHKQQTANMVLQALAETEQRAVLGAGWGDLGTGQRLPNSVFLLKSIPHRWLFPQMAVNIHHAGPGTTAAALSAGMPSVVIPHFASQYFYANRVAKLGVGPAPIDRKKLSAKNLTTAISVAATDQGMQETAKALGAQIRSEDGIRQAIQAIRRYVNT
jgi:UDP:flavonoid glycosyltransferase YjiC (YdhE family)